MKNLSNVLLSSNNLYNVKQSLSINSSLPEINGEKDTILSRMRRNEDKNTECFKILYTYRSQGVGLNAPVRTVIGKETIPCEDKKTDKNVSSSAKMCQYLVEYSLPHTSIKVKKVVKRKCESEKSNCIIL